MTAWPVESEQILLGIILSDNGKLSRVAELSPSDFVDDLHQVVFEVAKDRIGAGFSTNAKAVSLVLGTRRGAVPGEDAKYLSALEDEALGFGFMARDYAQVIIAASATRRVARALRDLGESLIQDSDPTKGLGLVVEALLDTCDGAIDILRAAHKPFIYEETMDAEESGESPPA